MADTLSPNRVSGNNFFALEKGTEGLGGGYLPMKIAIVAEPNTVNGPNMPTKLENALDSGVVGDLFGYGSPIYDCFTAIKGDNLNVGGIPVNIYPVYNDTGTPSSFAIALGGTATKTATQFISVGGKKYYFVASSGDTATEIFSKISMAINSDISSPFIVSGTAPDVVLTAKWNGITGNDIQVNFIGVEDVGITYAISPTLGAGAKSPADALALFENNWNTIIINGLGTTKSILDDFETFIGNPNSRTGRYNQENWLPAHVISSATSPFALELIDIAENRKEQVANVICAYPNAQSTPWVNASITAGIYSIGANGDPKYDIKDLPMHGIIPPADGDIGEMSNYDYRDLLVKNGISTCTYDGGLYYGMDFVTTYRPDSEGNTPVYRWVRDLTIDFNTGFKIKQIDDIFLKNKTIGSGESVNSNVISPDQVFALIVTQLINPFIEDGIYVDKDYILDNMKVEISKTNPTRMNRTIPYKRSSLLRINSTLAIVNFYFGE